MGLEGVAFIHKKDKQTDGRTDEEMDGQTERHKERKINTAKHLHAFWDYVNVRKTSYFSCRSCYIVFRIIMCVHNISCLIFIVEK